MYLGKCAREQNVWALRLSEIYRSLYKAKCQTSILLFVWLPTHYFFSLWMASWNGTLGNIEKGLKKRNEWPAILFPVFGLITDYGHMMSRFKILYGQNHNPTLFSFFLKKKTVPNKGLFETQWQNVSWKSNRK